jgi:hypothetical protein
VVVGTPAASVRASVGPTWVRWGHHSGETATYVLVLVLAFSQVVRLLTVRSDTDVQDLLR